MQESDFTSVLPVWFQGVVSWLLSGQPSMQYSLSLRQTSSSSCRRRISSSRRSVVGRHSMMLATYRLMSSLSCFSALVRSRVRGALDNASAVTLSFPGHGQWCKNNASNAF